MSSKCHYATVFVLARQPAWSLFMSLFDSSLSPSIPLEYLPLHSCVFSFHCFYYFFCGCAQSPAGREWCHLRAWVRQVIPSWPAQRGAEQEGSMMPPGGLPSPRPPASQPPRHATSATEPTTSKGTPRGGNSSGRRRLRPLTHPALWISWTWRNSHHAGPSLSLCATAASCLASSSATPWKQPMSHQCSCRWACQTSSTVWCGSSVQF